ncbi:MAG: hypothetical protein U0Q03_24420 [Acidimicrobiales bacterium]
MTGTHDHSGARIRRLVGVYDAEGTWRGEVRYWIGARLGQRHCSLCDITHGTFRVRREWIACRAGLPVEFATFHLDDQPDHVRAAADGAAPVVLAETDRGTVVLLGPAELEACDGSSERLVDAIESAVTALGLAWPTNDATS